MVCLNENISFNKINLKNNLNNEMIQHIRLNFELDLNKDMMEKIIRSVKNKFNDLFSSNHFIYLNMNNNLCTHMFRKGKKEGYFCCKKINSNGDKHEYVCTKHNKKHIPKKKIMKKNNNFSNEKNKVNIKIDKSKKDYINVLDVKSNNKRILKNKRKNINKKVKLTIHGEINFKDIMKKLLI